MPRKFAGVAAAIVASCAVLGLSAGNALAFSCDYDGVDEVQLDIVNEAVTISKGSLDRIIVNGLPCDGATASNTDHIFVNGSVDDAAGDLVTIDLGGGRFEPGTDNEAGRNEIEFQVVNADGLTVLGDAAPDEIQIGQVTIIGQLVVNLNGDNDADVIAFPLADVASVVVRGRGGDDVLSAKGGLNDGCEITQCGPASPLLSGLTLDGGDGDDSLQGGEGDDVLIGGPGDDTIDGNDNSIAATAVCRGFVIDPGTGQPDFGGNFVRSGDVVDYSGSAGPMTIDLDPNEGHPGTATGDGTDTLQNVEGVVGSPANDTLSGDDANNVLFGGAGDDTLAGDAGADCVFGNDGNDTLDENEGTSTAQGGTGTTNGSDMLFGNAGLDDTITYSARATRVNVFLEPLLGGADRLFTCEDIPPDRPVLTALPVAEDGADLDGDGASFDDEGDCVFLDTENAVTGSGNDLMSAAFVNNRTDNEFTANGGNDVMDAGAGNDTFHEGSAANGADDMDGGTGGDTCDYSARTNAVSVNLDAADNDGEAGEGDNCGGVVVTLDVPIGSPSRDGLGGPGGTIVPGEGGPEAPQDVENVLGGSGNDVLTGDDEANVLVGNAGNDALSGNSGTDVLQGGDGNDVLNGGAGNDSLDGGAGTDTVDFGGGAAVVINMAAGTASGQGNDTVTGGENASGTAGNDTIRGTSGNETLNGRGGNDTIQALSGDDVVNGGSGSDELGGGAGNDRISGGGGADTIRGGGGGDTLNGGPANDTLMGGRGDDSLFGGAGHDDHRGGAGSDSCRPGSPGLGAGDTASGCES
jgi:Ca2+-binding RTX toxin-like protein